MKTMTIGRLAKQAGLNIDTIRFYERRGLMPPPARRSSGYREYDAAEVGRLNFIRRAKRLGFSLDEIAELLVLSSGTDMAAIREAATAKLLEVEKRIKEMQRIRQGLKVVIEKCPGHGSPADCPIVSSLSGNNEH